jgi:membrane protease YdiL (CAAX protease family)
MLSAKPWKTEAIARLGASVFLCVLCGSLVVGLLHAVGGAGAPKLYAVSATALGFLVATVVLLRKPWGFDALERRLLPLLICFQAALLLWAWAIKLAGTPGPSIGQMVVGGLSFQGASLALVGWFLREHSTSWRDAFGFNNRWRHAALVGFLVAVLFLPIGRCLQFASAWLVDWAGPKMPGLHLKPEVQQAVQTLALARSWQVRAVLGVITILLAPVAEEVLFRGILYAWLKQRGFPRLALWGSASLFALMHMNLVAFVPLLLLAVALAILYDRTGNLLAPIVGHALFNTANFVELYREEWLRHLR